MAKKGIIAGSIAAVAIVSAAAIVIIKKDEIFPPTTTPPTTEPPTEPPTTPPTTQPPTTTPPTELPGTGTINKLTVNPTSGNKPLTVGFILDVDGVPQVIEWHYGDGIIEIGSTTKSHTYYTVGTFNGKVKVTRKDGTINERAFTIIVKTPLTYRIITNFWQSKATVTQNQSVAFSIALGEPYNNISEIRWKWGDGAADLVGRDNTILAVDHFYSKPGTFQGSVSGKLLNGTIETRNFTVIVEGDPTQTITVRIILSEFFGTTIQVGEKFRTWIDRIGGISPYIYEIDYGDGTILFQQDSYHSYAKSGSYIIKATVRDATGKSFSTTKTLSIDVMPLQVGDVKFAPDPLYPSFITPVKSTTSSAISTIKYEFDAEVINKRTDLDVSVRATAIIIRKSDNVTLATKNSSTISIPKGGTGKLTGYIADIPKSTLITIIVDLDDASGVLTKDLDTWTSMS